MAHRKLVLAIAGVCIVTIIVVSPVLGQGGSGQIPPYKQAFQARAQATQAVVEKGPHAPKHPELTFPTSCRKTTPEKTGIDTFRFGPFFGGRSIVNYASVVSSSGVHYMVYAGAPDDAPHQGLLRVLRDENDPCAATIVGSNSSYLRDYTTPTGPLKVIQIDGDVMVYATPDGGTGRFNVVTGQFLP
ncbi:MAG: hypothetical protein KGJ80_05330 [Chloroflexota bacterium]|nr:hypothetical protein [Chloroflexota bacterium]